MILFTQTKYLRPVEVHTREKRGNRHSITCCTQLEPPSREGRSHLLGKLQEGAAPVPPGLGRIGGPMLTDFRSLGENTGCAGTLPCFCSSFFGSSIITSSLYSLGSIFYSNSGSSAGQHLTELFSYSFADWYRHRHHLCRCAPSSIVTGTAQCIAAVRA
jgi:hypothetical protein